MQEVLSKTDDPHSPLSGQEFCELRLDDSDNIWMGRHVIREARAHWDSTINQIVWDEPVVEYAANLDLAMKCYEIRRAALVELGFTCSDMDL